MADSFLSNVLNKGPLGELKKIAAKTPSKPSATPIADVLKSVQKATPFKGTGESAIKGAEDVYTNVKKSLPNIPIVSDVAGFAAGLPGEVLKAGTRAVSGVAETSKNIAAGALGNLIGGVEQAGSTLYKGYTDTKKVIQEGEKTKPGSKERLEAITKSVGTPLRSGAQAGLQLVSGVQGVPGAVVEQGIIQPARDLETGIRGQQANQSLVDTALQYVDLGGQLKAATTSKLLGMGWSEEDAQFVGDIASLVPDAVGGFVGSKFLKYKQGKVPTQATQELDRRITTENEIIKNVKKINTTPETIPNYMEVIQKATNKILELRNNPEVMRITMEKAQGIEPTDIMRNKKIDPNVKFVIDQERKNPEVIKPGSDGMLPSDKLLLEKSKTQPLNEDELNHLTNTNSPIELSEPDKIAVQSSTDLQVPLKNVSKSAFDKMISKYQNMGVTLEKMTKDKATTISENTNAYIQRRNLEGIKGAVQINTERSLKAFASDMFKASPNVRGKKAKGAAFEVLKNDIEEYARAVHALDYNKQNGENAAGITTQVALEKRAAIESQPNFSNIQKFHKELVDIGHNTLDILEQSGLKSPEEIAKLRDIYKNYVPFQRDLPEELTSSGSLGKGAVLKRAHGSELAVKDIIANVFYNHQDAIIKSKTNLVAQSLDDFARQNPGNELLVPKNTVHLIPNKVIGVGEEGKVTFQKFIPADPNTIAVYRNGKATGLTILDDATYQWFAQHPTELGDVTAAIGTITRLMGAGFTRLNPDWIPPGHVRDLEDTLLTTAARKEMGIIGGIKSVLTASIEGKRAAWDWMHQKDTPRAKLYQEMMDDGGNITAHSQMSQKNVTEGLQEVLKNFSEGKLNKGRFNIIKILDNVSELLEGSSRYGIYKTAREQGLSRQQSAFNARDMMDFNLRGTKTADSGSWYVFFNASMQGGKKAMDIIRNPKVLAATVASSFMVQKSIGFINQMMAGEEDIDMEKEFTQDERNRNWIILTGGRDPVTKKLNRITIPKAPTVRPIDATVTEIIRASEGRMDNPGRSAWNILSNFTNTAASFIDVDNPLRGFVPTPFQPLLDVYSGVTRSNIPIRPDGNISEHEKYFRSLEDKPGGSMFINAAKILAESTRDTPVPVDISPANMSFLYSGYTGGPGKYAMQAMQTTVDLFTKGKVEITPGTFPLIRSFYGSTDPEQTAKRLERMEYETLKQHIDIQPHAVQKQMVQDYLDNKPKDDRQGIIYRLQQDGLDTKGLSIKEPDQRADFSETELQEKTLIDAMKKANKTLLSEGAETAYSTEDVQFIYDTYTKTRQKYSTNQTIKKMVEYPEFKNMKLTSDVLNDIINAFE